MKPHELSFHKDPRIFSLNEMEYRSYFVPFEAPEKTTLKREESAFFTSLCGEWLFKYAESAYDMRAFWHQGADLGDFEKVRVPETWQLNGKDRAQYQTSPYPFLYNPPFPPSKNPCAAYVKDFDILKKENKNYELHFEGKDSCIYVWLNGSFVGYGEVPHQDSTFDITPFLRDGKNVLCALVFKWCSGSYLDDQDKIRLSGIFRDVYILERSKKGLKDFSVLADMHGNLSLRIRADAPVEVTLLDGERVVFSATVEDHLEYRVPRPVLWSAEAPYLYTLLLSCEGEYVRQAVGFRTCETQNGVFTVNGKAVKLYGVDRHDFSPDSGYVLDCDFIEAELTMMKRYNINAIRTAHYPNDPRFYEICDRLGFYVMCEADQECHGVSYVDGWDEVVNHEQFEGVFVDRMARMYETFKNYPCIVIWSLGNESGWGKNLEKCVEYFDAREHSRPLHYQAFTMVTAMNRGEENNSDTVFTEELDAYIHKHFGMLAMGYPKFAHLRNMLQRESLKLPIVFHEYSHAMGNSCGDLRFYDEIIQQNDRCMGGFIWEWCDQALRLTDENGTEFFGYGGDFGEKHHLHNICMDGLVAPDRTPHSALLEAAACFSPVKIGRRENGEYELFNRNFFLDTAGYDIRYEILADNAVLQSGIIALSVPPRKRVVFGVKTKEPYEARDAILRFSVVLKEEAPWAPKGHAVYQQSFALPCRKAAETTRLAPPVLRETDSAYAVSLGGLTYIIRKDSGVIRQILNGEKELLSAPMELTVWRMPTDNDNRILDDDNGLIFGGGVGRKWRKTKKFGELPYPWTEVMGLTCRQEGESVIAEGDFILAVPGRLPIAKGHIEYRFTREGLTVRQRGGFHRELDFWLPRYGYRFSFADGLTDTRYFGFGPEECYEDKREYATLGWYDYRIDDEKNSYEKPQECNSRVDTKWLRFSADDVEFEVSADRFSFCITCCDVNEGWRQSHTKDLKKSNGTFLHLDYRMSGVGSNSCGGEPPLPSCRLCPDEEFDFSFTIKAKK